MTGAPTWYDLLGIVPDASSEEVRTAWKAQIADLEPGDRRFDALNRAAKVLLDPVARAEYDAGLAADTEDQDDIGPEAGRPAPPTSGPRDSTAVENDASTPVTRRRAPAVPTWLLAGLGVVTAALVAVTAWVWVDRGTGDGDAVRAAQAAAERAVVPVLSYDYADLEGSQQRARALMTGGYAEEYDKLFQVIADNAPGTETTVSVDVLSSGIVRASEDRVQVLVFVDRPTTNKANPEPVVYKDQVTLSMQRVDEEWLVDDLVTSPVGG